MDGPLVVVAIVVAAYWIIVAGMVVKHRLGRGGHAAGAVPRELVERLMWIPWVPVVAAWIALPILALRKDEPPWALPAFATATWATVGRWTAAALLVAAFGVTLRCWRSMGRSWTIAVVPDQETSLVTSGPFGVVRHPIYALSMTMIVLSTAVLPTWPMAVAAVLHVILNQFKVRNEERHLRRRHGAAYDAYARRVGRFVPRWRA